jgi:hypothetical protein
VRPEATYFAVWEIDTATNKVLAASPGKGKTDGIAFTPDSHTLIWRISILTIPSA